MRPLKTLPMSFSVCLIPCMSFEITKAPTAAPRMMIIPVRQRMQDDLEMAAGEDITAEHHDEDDADADDYDSSQSEPDLRVARRRSSSSLTAGA